MRIDFQRLVTQSPDRGTFDTAALTFRIELSLLINCYGWA
jgi:hypothetical protein